MDHPEAVRLQLRLSRAGIASRRHCETYIAEGRVTVNGEIVTTPGTKVAPDDEIRFDGRLIRTEKRKVYIALHKPSGFLCSDDDPDGRPLAKSLLNVAFNERIYHVGRLDYMTSGLIFYTNDGDFARALTHPSRKVEKEYLVTTKNEIPEALMKRFLEGIVVEGIRYRASKAELSGPRSARIVLTEGKNKELRRVFLSMAVSIKKVHRIRIGPVQIKGIPSGHFRNLTEREIKALTGGVDSKKGSGEHRRPAGGHQRGRRD